MEYGQEARQGHPWAWDGAIRRLRGGCIRFIDGVGGRQKSPLPGPLIIPILPFPVSEGLLSWPQLCALVTRELRQET